MKLIATLTSPFARKIRIMLLEKALPFELVLDSPLEPDTRVADYNPLIKVPALVTDNCETFFDSPVIAGYLETLGAEPRLLPTDPIERVRVRQLEAIADGIMDASVAIVLDARLSGGKASGALASRQMEKIIGALAALERQACDRIWLHSNDFSLADIATGVALNYLDLRFADMRWRDDHPALAALETRTAARTSFIETVPPVG